MGLDNGVYMHTRHKISSENLPPRLDLHLVEEPTGYCYEIAYFRKAWAVHDLMYDILNFKGSTAEIEGSVKELELFKDGLHRFLDDPDEFDERSQVFFMDEANTVANIGFSIMRCSWAIKYAKEHPEVYFEFVDSY